MLGGIWCILRISYIKQEEDEEEDLFGEKKKAKKNKPVKLKGKRKFDDVIIVEQNDTTED